ncbi:MAG: penicillin-binding protein activator LpoB [Bradymonadaceae bacterium]
MAVWLAFGAGCAAEHARGSENPELDKMTMSLRFDRTDLNNLYKQNIDKLLDSKVIEQWKETASSGKPPVVAIFPIRNETSEHIRQPLDALLSKFQTDLVNNSPVDVISSNQKELIAEVKRQQSAAYDPKRLASYGKQLGAQYYVTGKVYDVAERTKDGRRVQYFLFIQVLDVETGAIKFQAEASVSKALLG